jgi:hypothetical protein
MAWGRFGDGPMDDDQPIEFWMDDRNDQVAQRDTFDAAGRERWNASTRSGEDLDASRPSDVVALGNPPGSPAAPRGADQDVATADPPAGDDGSGDQPNAPPSPSGPSVRYVKAQAGDNVTRLVGGSDPAAVGAFARLNGMDGRNSTIYAGRVYAIPTGIGDAAPENAALGGRILQHDDARMTALRAQRAANDQFLARFNAGKNVWTGEPVGAGPNVSPAAAPTVAVQPFKPAWYDNPLVKIPAGVGALGAGLAYGALIRGPYRTGQFIGDAANFGERLLDPNDEKNHPYEEAARDQLRDFGRNTVAIAQSAIDDPRLVGRFLRDQFHDARVSGDPTATPVAASLADEMKNKFEIGATDGEFLTPVGAIKRVRGIVDLVHGGEEAAGAARYAAKVKPGEYARLIKRGDPPPMADHLSDPYPKDAMGSHYKARSAKVPDRIFGVPLPESIAGQPWARSFIDSPLNVNKFEGMSRDQAYTGHYGYGAGFYGARLPADVNGGLGWSGRRLGARRYGPVERHIKGAPPTLKKAVAGTAAVGGLTAYNLFGGDRPDEP